MSAPLLMTKLYAPPPHTNLVPRPRLIERLEEGIQEGARLTLVSAPAGFGKTTLLAEWVQESGRDVVWISLDEGDNDPTRFLAYLITGLQRVPDLDEAGIGSAVLPTLMQPASVPGASQRPKAALTALINEITICDPTPFLILLDDYHVITEDQVHSVVSFMLDNMPPQMHLVVATRADPPLPIARLRVRGQLNELRQSELRFSSEEAAALLRQASDSSLTADDVDALVTRTEGWVAGLQVAGISLRGRDDVSRFITAFEGSHRHILDYLLQEVLSRESKQVQTFLLQTSILDQMSADLANTLLNHETRSAGTGQGRGDVSPKIDSQQILEYLEHANLFVVPLDDRREWYRYHHLFADLLRMRLSQQSPELVSDLHRRASEWYEAEGLMSEAIDHALLSDGLERAADLIEQNAQAALMRSEVATFLRWVESLPEELVRARTLLSTYYAAALLWNGRPLTVVQSYLPEMVASAEVEDLEGEVAAAYSLALAFKGDVQRFMELSEHALRVLPDENILLRGVAAASLGIAHVMMGNTEAAVQVMEHSVDLAQRTGNAMLAVGTTCNIAGLLMTKSQLDRAIATYQRALDMAVDDLGRQLPVAGKALLGLGEIARERNDLDAAIGYLELGSELASQYMEIGNIMGHCSLALVEEARGNRDRADAHIEKARQLAVRFDATEIDDVLVDVSQVRLWLSRGDLDSAARGVETWHEGEETRMMHDLREIREITRARLHIAQEEADQALTLLEPLLVIVERMGRTRRLIEITALKAAALYVGRDVEEALLVLGRALELGEPAGFVRTFVDIGLPMARLLHEAASRGIAPEYAGRLLAAFDTPKAQEPPLRAQPLIEPLSERELEVLACLTQGLTNAELGQRLHISLPTVKSHTRNIYAKLGVHNRREAVARAKKLGIIPA